MRPLWRDILSGILMGMVVPGILLNLTVAILDQREEITEAPVQSMAESTSTAMPLETKQQSEPLRMLLRCPDGELREMNMDTYLVGVLMGEMPAWFEEEALKAQAVVARTYTLKAYTTGGKHGDGSICTQSGCCQAYTTEEAYLAQGGSILDVEKYRNAVEATSGMVLMYDGTLIEATYFSCSGGSTEDAAAVWGTDYPYLRAVSSPGEEEATHYTDTASFTDTEFCTLLGIKPEGAPSSWLGNVSYTSGGGIAYIDIGGESFTGTQLRQRLGLRSTAITMAAEGNQIIITTRGFGHRVGMSQYGADAMAAAGSSYEEILAHYYQGARLVLWDTGG